MMTEEQVERAVEHEMDVLDARLMNGTLTQEVYDAEVRLLNRWAEINCGRAAVQESGEERMYQIMIKKSWRGRYLVYSQNQQGRREWEATFRLKDEAEKFVDYLKKEVFDDRPPVILRNPSIEY